MRVRTGATQAAGPAGRRLARLAGASALALAVPVCLSAAAKATTSDQPGRAAAGGDSIRAPAVAYAYASVGVAAFRPPGNTVIVTNPGAQSGVTGSPVRLQLSGSDSASGQALAYRTARLPAGLMISRTGLITGTPTAVASYNVVVTATDSAGAAGSTAFRWTVRAAGSGCPARQLLGNPGFETGKIAPWTSSANVLQRAVPGTPAHAGTWLAWLDGYVGRHTDTLAQTVTIPSGCASVQLSLWLDIISNDPAGHAYDTLTIQVTPSGSGPVTLAKYSNLDAAASYVRHTFSLLPFAGKTITITLTGVQRLGGVHITSFLDDGNAVNVS